MRRLAAFLLLTVLLAGCGAKPAKIASPGAPGADQGKASDQTVSKQWNNPPEMVIDPAKKYVATVETSKGTFKIQLLADESPKTVNNFVFLAREGFYENVKFHRIIKTFMIQTGDPTGTGAGGPGYKFNDELPPKHKYEPGIVAMANAGPNTNGSQFFICTGADAAGLNSYPNYTQFGRVTEGIDVVQAIAATPVGPRGREVSNPLEDVRITKVTVEEQ